ncbi:MAG TPA: hypothetical protein VG276_27890 [Actinomycetes bacterium]|jgi:hypothetical protein|nr:hypothetical protein [Actinomycetes bacterium]
MAALVTNVAPLSGLALSTLLAAASTPANGDDYETGPGLFLLVQNGGGSPITVTLVTPELVDGDLTVADRTSVSIPATAGLAMIPLTQRYRDPATGRGTVTFSSTTSVKAIVVRTLI